MLSLPCLQFPASPISFCLHNDSNLFPNSTGEFAYLLLNIQFLPSAACFHRMEALRFITITCLALNSSKDDPSIRRPQHLDCRIPRYVYVNIINADLSPSINKLGHRDFVCFRRVLRPRPDSMLSDVPGRIFSRFCFVCNFVRVGMHARRICLFLQAFGSSECCHAASIGKSWPSFDFLRVVPMIFGAFTVVSTSVSTQTGL